MTRAALAAVLMLASATDYALVLPHERDCAKSAQTCEAARQAIGRGWLPGVAPGTPARCEPAPDCFSARSDCIANFNCGERKW
jgi:hypothetical protein